MSASSNQNITGIVDSYLAGTTRLDEAVSLYGNAKGINAENVSKRIDEFANEVIKSRNLNETHFSKLVELESKIYKTLPTSAYKVYETTIKVLLGDNAVNMRAVEKTAESMGLTGKFHAWDKVCFTAKGAINKSIRREKNEIDPKIMKQHLVLQYLSLVSEEKRSDPETMKACFRYANDPRAAEFLDELDEIPGGIDLLKNSDPDKFSNYLASIDSLKGKRDPFEKKCVLKAALALPKDSSADEISDKANHFQKVALRYVSFLPEDKIEDAKTVKACHELANNPLASQFLEELDRIPGGADLLKNSDPEKFSNYLACVESLKGKSGPLEKECVLMAALSLPKDSSAEDISEKADHFPKVALRYLSFLTEDKIEDAETMKACFKLANNPLASQFLEELNQIPGGADLLKNSDPEKFPNYFACIKLLQGKEDLSEKECILLAARLLPKESEASVIQQAADHLHSLDVDFRQDYIGVFKLSHNIKEMTLKEVLDIRAPEKNQEANQAIEPEEGEVQTATATWSDTVLFPLNLVGSGLQYVGSTINAVAGTALWYLLFSPGSGSEQDWPETDADKKPTAGGSTDTANSNSGLPTPTQAGTQAAGTSATQPPLQEEETSSHSLVSTHSTTAASAEESGGSTMGSPPTIPLESSQKASGSSSAARAQSTESQLVEQYFRDIDPEFGEFIKAIPPLPPGTRVERSEDGNSMTIKLPKPLKGIVNPNAKLNQGEYDRLDRRDISFYQPTRSDLVVNKGAPAKADGNGQIPVTALGSFGSIGPYTTQAILGGRVISADSEIKFTKSINKATNNTVLKVVGLEDLKGKELELIKQPGGKSYIQFPGLTRWSSPEKWFFKDLQTLIGLLIPV